MKKLALLSATVMIFAAANAQNDVAAIKKDVKNTKQQESVIRKKEKQDKKQLRKLEGQEVSFQAKQSFYADFGDVTPVAWTRMEQYDKAAFSKNGHEMSAYYDADAQLIGTTSIKTFSDLPEAAQKHILKHYPGFSIDKVLFFDDNEFNETDMLLYGMQFADQDNYFVELKKDNKKEVLQVNPQGEVFFYSEIK